MKVILIMVQTVNGFITRGDDPDIYTWTSREDADFFFSKLHNAKLIVMGSGTFEASRKKIRARAGQLRIILTRNPEKYSTEEIPGKLEFRDSLPSVLVSEMERMGYDEMLLVGGGRINKLFLEANLINELFLTIEPKIFSDGKPIFQSGEYDCTLELLSSQKLNTQGTLLLHYKVC